MKKLYSSLKFIGKFTLTYAHKTTEHLGITPAILHLAMLRILHGQKDVEKTYKFIDTLDVNRIPAQHVAILLYASWKKEDYKTAFSLLKIAQNHDGYKRLSHDDKAMVEEIARLIKNNNKTVSKEYYNSIYASSNEYSQTPEESIYIDVWECVAEKIKENSPERILDIGCGPGQFAYFLNKKIPQVQYTGVDFSTTAIAIAQKRCPNYTFIAANATSVRDMPPESYDLVITLEVLEHIENDLELLQQLCHGKRIVFSVPDFDSFSHVRYFKDKEEVLRRYSELVDIQDITEVNISPKTKLFVATGKIK